VSQQGSSKESSMSLLFLGLRDRGKWGKVGILPGDIALIANSFVKNRPQKNRGINIDVFVSRTNSFHELAISKDLVKVGEKFWIAETRTSVDQNAILGNSVMHFLGYSEDFLPGYSRLQAFVLELEPRGFCIVSSFRRAHHDKLARNLLMKLYPGATRAFLTSRDMYRIISSANKLRKYDLRVRTDFARESGEDEETALEYHGKPVQELPTIDGLFRAKKNLRRSLTMYKLIAAQSKIPFEITFTGEGHISLYEGGFEEITSDYVTPVIDVSFERIKRFSKRSMSETIDKKPRPIEIDFESDQFTTAGDMKSLIAHIQKYSHCNYSIVHSGNPHLFMYLMDSKEHSTFSLRTLGSDKLIISPQIKTSPESMARFADHLLSLPKLSDGEIAPED